MDVHAACLQHKSLSFCLFVYLYRRIFIFQFAQSERSIYVIDYEGGVRQFGILGYGSFFLGYWDITSLKLGYWDIHVEFGILGYWYHDLYKP